MKKFVYIALCGAAFTMPANAGTVLDVGTLTCADLEKMNQQTLMTMLSWIDGYLGGQSEDTKLDVDRLQNNANAAEKACKADPNAGILSVLKDIDTKSAQ